MLTLSLALAVCVLGAVLYLAAPGKPSQMGLAAFAVGLLVSLLSAAGAVSITASARPGR